MNKKNNDDIELLQRFGWVLFDDINRRLGILIEECSHLQQVVHYYGDFEITEHYGKEQREMEHPKIKTKSSDYIRDKPSSHAVAALYEHLGGLVIGLKSHQEEVRSRFEAFLESENSHSETWFWFISLRSHLLQEVLEQYMMLLEHAHEKLIQILETKPGQLPQAILLRRWNSALHGRFLSEYSRHLDWETNELFNHLKFKKQPLTKEDQQKYDEQLKEARHHSSFIHSWAHTPTSMVTAFLVTDPKHLGVNKNFKLGSIRSAFFYLEMPQLYPLLYHECAHLQFNWDKEAVNDEGEFFKTRRKIKETLEETVEYCQFEKINGWSNFVDEICADAMAIALGGISYVNALVMQIMGQSSACFFYSDPNLPLQKWAKQPIYDLVYPATDEYFWEARIKLAMLFLKKICISSVKNEPKECEELNNQAWLKAVELGIKTYQQGGETIFASNRISQQHQDFWQYRKSLNDWVYETIKDCNLPDTLVIPNSVFTGKYWIRYNFIDTVLIPNVRNFEGQFFTKHSHCENEVTKLCQYKDEDEGKDIRIEYLVFHVKWYLSKRVIKEINIIGKTNIVDKKNSKNKSLQTFTYSYANFIQDCSTGVFRLALEWFVARNDLIAVFADYLEDSETIQAQYKKLFSDSNSTLEIELNNCKNGDSKAKENIICDLRHQKNYDQNSKPKIIKDINSFINKYMDDNVVKCFEQLNKNDTRINIGTFTFGTFSKNRINSNNDNKSLYLNGATAVYDYYMNVNKCINNQKIYDTNIDMPYDYISGNKFSYGSINVEEENKPSQSSLYFITGDYDFIHHQDGITSSEFTCHPYRQIPILTKSRTVLDLCKHYINNNNEDYIDRQPWGRVSLIKFRYRWEMYHLAEYLKQQDYRSRLHLSSAWEDGILITWHKDVSNFWKEGYEKGPLSIHNTLDSQSSLILFKLKAGELKTGETRKPVAAHDKEEEIRFDINPSNKTDLYELIKAKTKPKKDESEPKRKDEKEHWIFKNAHLSHGRFDYTVVWDANTPKELASSLFSLPASFWCNITHINTAFGYKFEIYEPYFVSEITANMFPSIKKNNK